MAAIQHRVVQANGIRMHVAEAGEGFPVVMCHGWPELWYSWRHQLVALADVGFHGIAPDMRGYGETDASGAGVRAGGYWSRAGRRACRTRGVAWAPG